jgi:eukaryotic-like serine/threonine-protein kinase
VSASASSDGDYFRRANDLFHRALDVPPQERDALLSRECGGDERLRQEVTALLDAHSRAETFLEEPNPERDALALQREVGHYRIERVLGVGGMGVVYLAHDTRLGRPVALKAITAAFTHDAGRRERLRREARAAASLTHPGVATVYAFEEIDDHAFIVGEYVAGETLREEIGRGALTASQTIDTAIGIADALAAAHDRGIVHRDLKPENLIRTPTGQVKILDFGLARLRDEGAHEAGLTEDGAVLGTPAYMAPEQIRRDPVDGRADLFSLGVVLYELVTGVQPFSGRDAASTIARILEVEPAAFPETDAGVPDDRRLRSALDAIVRTCLRKLPAARFATARDLVAALERVRAGRFDSVPLPSAVSGVALRWWKFHQAATCVTYAALMLPLWLARPNAGAPGRYLFLAALGSAVASIVLRLHLWFTAASLPTEWKRQHRSVDPWLRVADSAMVACCLVTGGLVVDNSPALAGVLLCAAVAVLLSFTLIEPATRRAAFES